MDVGLRFVELFGTAKPIIGMVHLAALPGSPRYDRQGGMPGIIRRAEEDADALVEGGIDGIQVENQFDRPFLKPQDIGFETVAAMTSAICAVRRRVSVPLGVNVHLNGARQALAVALAAGCRWIRVFELANAYISNAGIIEAAGPEVIRLRADLGAERSILVFGDFHVKHGSHALTADRSLEEQAEDVETALADAVIVTGLKTGEPPDEHDIRRIAKAVSIPVLIGSGLALENLAQLLPPADGAIVGTAFKVDGRLENRIDPQRVREFMTAARSVRGDTAADAL